MANSIALAQKYLAILDEVYKQASKSSVLESGDIKFVGANAVQLYKTSMQGMGDYDRQNGFVGGDVTGAWETLTLNQDRGRSFTIDAMDNEETLGMAFGTLAGEFIRTQVAPEVDAYCFSKIVGTDGIQHGTHDQLADIASMANEVDAGIAALNEKEVPDEGRLLFISEKAYQKLQGNITRQIDNSVTGINKTVEMYDGCRVIRVPQARFLSAITLYNGKSGQAAGGYVGAATNYNIHFILLHPSAVKRITKHALLRIFAPAENQQADGYKVDYRLYYDEFIMANKLDGIYFLRSDVANA